ncbi:MAG TPA: hypothetical protein VFB54_02355 [Burkholderiales bacterium]|nr:hypothetical protein [Burkholderiales bacterium]
MTLLFDDQCRDGDTIVVHPPSEVERLALRPWSAYPGKLVGVTTHRSR